TGGAATNVSSTFINHNSFAAYAGIGLVVICGLIFRLYERELVFAGPRRLQIASFIEASGQKGGLLLAAAFVLVAALLLTGSRGGVIAAGFGLLAQGVLTFRRQRREGGARWIIVVAGLAGVAILLAFGDLFLAGLAERGVGDAGRMAVYVVTLRSIFDAP